MVKKDIYLASSVNELNKLAKVRLPTTDPGVIESQMLMLKHKAIEIYDSDEERSYVLFMRYCDLYEKLKVVAAAIATTNHSKLELSHVLDYMEQLYANLQERYENLRKSRMRNTEPILDAKEPVTLDPIESPWMNSSELAQAVQKRENLLIIDVRYRSEFDACHIRFDKIMNLPMDQTLKLGTTVNTISSFLSNGSDLKLWNDRGKFTTICLMDECGIQFDENYEVFPENALKKSNALRILKDALTKWDAGRTVVIEPKILTRGMIDFHKHYAPLTTSSQYNRKFKQVPPKPNSASQIDYPEMQLRIFPNMSDHLDNFEDEDNLGNPDTYPLHDDITVDVDHVHPKSPVLSNSVSTVSKPSSMPRPNAPKPVKLTKALTEHQDATQITLQPKNPPVDRSCKPKFDLYTGVSTKVNKSSDPVRRSYNVIGCDKLSNDSGKLHGSSLTQNRENSFSASLLDKPQVIVKSKNTDYREISEKPIPSAISSGNSKPVLAQHRIGDTSSNCSTEPVLNNSVSSNELLQIYRTQTCGLPNLGNTCYVNSVIQCVAHVRAIAHYFLDIFHKRTANSDSDFGYGGDVVKYFEKLLSAMYNGLNVDRELTNFRAIVSKHQKKFATTDQQDALEFFHFLLDGLHEDLNEARPSRKEANSLRDATSNSDQSESNPSPQEVWLQHKRLHNSIIVSSFQGLLKSNTRCLNCQNLSTKYDVLMVLSLPLEQIGPCTLLDCFQSYLKFEYMTESSRCFCPNCDAYKDAIKWIELWRLPTYLIIQINRFQQVDNVWRKQATFVDYPIECLDVSSFLVGPKCHSNEYALFAVINHYGSLESGHYTSYCRNIRDGQWYLYDDQCVTPQPKVKVKTADAYILLYELLPRMTVFFENTDD